MVGLFCRQFCRQKSTPESSTASLELQLQIALAVADCSSLADADPLVFATLAMTDVCLTS